MSSTPRPRWQGPRGSVAAWREIGASPFVCRNIEFGILDPPQVPFTEGRVAAAIPQTDADIEFAADDLARGCAEGIYEEVHPSEIAKLRATGLDVAAGFVNWQEKAPGQWKARFVIDFHEQSLHWPKGSTRMGSLGAFASSFQPGDHMISFDVAAGYRHFRLHPKMRNYFLFHYGGKFYRCVALPFGWGRSPWWFICLMRPFVRKLRELGSRVLDYLDDFLLLPSPLGQVATADDCSRMCRRVDDLMSRLGLSRHPSKGEWNGSTEIEHLGVRINTVTMRFEVTENKLAKVRNLARKLLDESRRGRRWVSRGRLRSMAGVCVSLSLAVPLSRFWTRALYDDMSPKRNRTPLPAAARRGRRVRLSRQTLSDLRVWRDMTDRLADGRDILPIPTGGLMHSDASLLGFGGTLGRADDQPGDPGQQCVQSLWTPSDRRDGISVLELRAVRRLVEGPLGEAAQRKGITDLAVAVDNMATVCATRAFTSASLGMMTELRRLKRALDARGFRIQSRWLPSAANRHADSLSRQFPTSGIRVRRQLTRSVLDTLRTNSDRIPSWAPSLGEPPGFLRRNALADLRRPWSKTNVQVLYPPVDLAAALVHKLHVTGAPALLLLPRWPGQQWYQSARTLALRTYRVSRPAAECFSGHRRINPRWEVEVFAMGFDPGQIPPTAAKPLLD